MRKNKYSHKPVKQIFAFLLVMILCLLQPVISASAIGAGNASGSTSLTPSDSEVISITSVSDLEEMAALCVTDTWSQNKVVSLEKDIELTNSDFTPIPTFGGVFLGNGHSVKGLTLKGGSDNCGLFRYLQESGEIHDLNLSGTATADKAHSGLGLLVGRNSGLVDNCTVVATVTGGDQAGILAGFNDITGVISNCTTHGSLYGNHLVGGVSGENRGSIISCTNHSEINTSPSDNELDLTQLDLNIEHLLTTENAASVTDIGGIAGSNSGIVKACVNDGAVGYQHVGYNIGGITGSQTGYIEGCINYGVLNGRKDVGGIAGQMEPSSEFEFSEDTLARLNVEFDKLHDQLTQLDKDTSNASSSLTGQVDTLLSSVENAQNAINTILDQASADFSAVSNHTDLATLPSPSPVSLDFFRNLPTQTPSQTPAPTGTPSPTQLPTPTATPTEEPVPTATPTPTEEPTPSATPTEEPAPTPTPTETADASEVLGLLTPEFDSFTAEQLMDAPKRILLPIKELDPPETSTPTPSATPTSEVSPSASPWPSFLPLPTGGDLNNDLNTVDWDAAEKEINDLQQNTYNDASSVLNKIQSNTQSQAALASYRIASARSSLSSSFGQIIKDMDLLNSMLDEHNQVVLQDFQVIIDEMNVISDIITDPQTTDPDDIVADISDDDREEDITGKVMNCTNKGNVYGDLNLGGITGSMARENNLDPEDDLGIDENTATLNFRYKERIVIRSCKNNGSIEGKKDYAGGIAGEMTLGSIFDCINCGSVTSDGDMIGGIAGSSASSIHSCSSKCALSGGSQIGGIAGFGTVITDCYSMTEILEGKNYLGSIAGKTDSTDSSEISNNYFVEGCPPAIDGINYSGLAEPLSYDTFITAPDLPPVFRHIYLTFQADNQEIAIITLDYGGSLEPTRIPAIPEKEGYSGKWEDFEDHNIIFDQTIHAIYRESITALESFDTRDGRSILLAEGQFTPEDTITLSSIEAYPDDAQTNAECWRVKINSACSGPFLIHYLIPEDMENPAVELLHNESWLPVQTEKDGSYFIFTSDTSDFVFSCTDRPEASHNGVLIAVILGICLLGILLLLFLWYHYKRHKSSKSEHLHDSKETNKT